MQTTENCAPSRAWVFSNAIITIIGMLLIGLMVSMVWRAYMHKVQAQKTSLQLAVQPPDQTPPAIPEFNTPPLLSGTASPEPRYLEQHVSGTYIIAKGKDSWDLVVYYPSEHVMIESIRKVVVSNSDTNHSSNIGYDVQVGTYWQGVYPGKAFEVFTIKPEFKCDTAVFLGVSDQTIEGLGQVIKRTQ